MMSAATSRTQLERLRALRAEGARVALSLAEHDAHDAQFVLSVAMQIVRFLNAAPGLVIVTQKEDQS